MFGASTSPDPFDAGGGGDSPAGGDQVVAFVTPEIVPVRIVNTNALEVIVTNFPGQPPPLGGLKAGATPPPLPGMGVPKAKGPEGVGLKDLGLGKIAELGTVAGIAAAGVGLVAKGFEDLKSSFIDPILGAAKSGLDRGIERGSGVEVLNKTASVLGVTIGVLLLPVTIRLAAKALVLAENFDHLQDRVERMFGGGLGESIGRLGGRLSQGKFDRDTLRELKNVLGEANAFGHNAMFPGIGAAGEVNKAAKGTGHQERDSTLEVLDDLRRSLGTAQAQFVGVADVRSQAQAAALQDPMVAKLRQLQVVGLEKVINEMAPNLAKTAENTKPKEHHG